MFVFCCLVWSYISGQLKVREGEEGQEIDSNQGLSEHSLLLPLRYWDSYYHCIQALPD